MVNHSIFFCIKFFIICFKIIIIHSSSGPTPCHAAFLLRHQTYKPCSQSQDPKSNKDQVRWGVAELKWSSSGYPVRRPDDSNTITDWHPRTGYRSIGRLTAREADAIASIAGRTCMVARDRGEWHKNL